MKKIEPIKLLGIFATVGGIVVSLASDFVKEQKTDKLIEEKITKALAEREKKKA